LVKIGKNNRQFTQRPARISVVTSLLTRVKLTDITETENVSSKFMEKKQTFYVQHNFPKSYGFNGNKSTLRN
jgi:hypothetical protein